MSLDSRTKLWFERVAWVLKDHKDKLWDLSTLNTTEKSNLVWALNELKAGLDGIDLTDLINDSAAATNTTWSSSKIQSELNNVNTTAAQAITDLINWAPDSADTLKELSDQIVALAQADTWLVSASAAQSFTEAQKAQARSNIDAVSTTDFATFQTAVGNTDTDYVSAFDAIYNA